MDLYGDGHKIVTDADHIPGRNYLSGTAPVSVQGQNIVGQAITTYTLTDKSLSNQVVTFNMAVTSDTTSGRVFVGSSPNWQVYTYYDVQKGINKIQFTTELNSDVDGITISLDNSTANLVIKDVTLNKGNFAREYSPAPEDYAMKSDLHGLFHIERVDKTVKAQTTKYQIVAPTVEGYQFLFWLSSATVNWIGSTYIDDPTYYSPSIWIAYPQNSNLDAKANGVNLVRGFAVYIKNPVA